MKLATTATISLAIGMLAGGRAAADSADQLLAQAMAAPSTISYAGVVSVVRRGKATTEVETYRVAHRAADDLTRRIYSAPPTLAGDSVIIRRAEIFSVDPLHRRVFEARNDAAGDSFALAANVALLHANYRAARRGDERFDGRRCADLAIVNRASGRTAMLVRIDAVTKLVLDKREYSANGALVAERRFTSVSYSIPPAADFTLPKQYAIERDPAFGEMSWPPDRIVTLAGFHPADPSALPGGFAPVDATMVTLHGVRTVHLLYSDGLRTVSLFESATRVTIEAASLRSHSMHVRGHEAEYGENGATELLAWSDGTLHYTLVGQFGLVNLPAIAASIGR
ncbi:MAG: hypothetical protein JOZ77_03120 [Candidatus Eremiobacteraeota bacterium]|nr:hypothetical protein [Candidatus Eremiobacteraeota bacterium]